jgi:hypothetical protein
LHSADRRTGCGSAPGAAAEFLLQDTLFHGSNTMVYHAGHRLGQDGIACSQLSDLSYYRVGVGSFMERDFQAAG